MDLTFFGLKFFLDPRLLGTKDFGLGLFLDQENFGPDFLTKITTITTTTTLWVLTQLKLTKIKEGLKGKPS